MSNGIIHLTTYSRPEILEKCLLSIYSARNSAQYKKIIVLQTGNSKVEKLIYTFADENTQVIKVTGIGNTPLQNMNKNRWIGLQSSFLRQGTEWVLCLEEDVEIHLDSLIFINQVFEVYRKNRHFRGINLASVCESDLSGEGFSLLRFGTHANAGVITRKTWNRLNRLWIDKTLNSFALDSSMEPSFRSGFIVAPNASLIIDYGNIGGTHISETENSDFFQKIRRSFEIRMRATSSSFNLNQHSHLNWRSDCKEFNQEENLKFLLLEYLLRLRNTVSYHKSHRLLRNLKRILLRRPII